MTTDNTEEDNEGKRNYYQTERYPFWLINDFAKHTCGNLSPALNMSEKDVSDTDLYYGVPAGVEVLYRFTDHEEETPALGFRRLPHDEAQDGDYHHIYELVYIDPSLTSLWKEVMDRDLVLPYISSQERSE